jgi:cytochrome P450
VHIPAHSKILLFMGAANRDPRKWGEDADVFDPGRPAPEFLSARGSRSAGGFLSASGRGVSAAMNEAAALSHEKAAASRQVIRLR